MWRPSTRNHLYKDKARGDCLCTYQGLPLWSAFVYLVTQARYQGPRSKLFLVVWAMIIMRISIFLFKACIQFHVQIEERRKLEDLEEDVDSIWCTWARVLELEVGIRTLTNIALCVPSTRCISWRRKPHKIDAAAKKVNRGHTLHHWLRVSSCASLLRSSLQKFWKVRNMCS